LEMAKNSLFAILLRSPWWISVAIAGGIGVVARVVLPEAYVVYGAFVATPFLVIAGISVWKQLQAPTTARGAETLDAVRAMSWGAFSSAIEDAFRRDGYVVSRLDGAEADFEMTKGWRTVLVSCKRWKVARTGIEPLRDLYAAKDAREAHECIYIAAGEITDNARKFAAEKKMRLLYGAELAQLLPGVGGGRKG
jgi:restriction system protein